MAFVRGTDSARGEFGRRSIFGEWGCTAGKDTKTKNANKGYPCTEVHVEFPKHGCWDNNSEEEISQDIKRGVRVRE